MLWLWIGLGLLSVILSFVISVTLVCYHRMFHSKPRVPLKEDEYAIPDGEIYQVFREDMIRWTQMIRAYPYREYSIKSFDGLTLRAKYFELEQGAPIELMFHGYRGNAERDLSGGVERCFRLGHSALLIDHRGSGYSDGSILTFGILEKRDCRAWIDFAIREFGEDAKLILTEWLELVIDEVPMLWNFTACLLIEHHLTEHRLIQRLIVVSRQKKGCYAVLTAAA